MQKNEDHFALWVISGVIGVTTRDIYSFFAKLIGLAKFYIWEIGAGIFVERRQAILSPLGDILGFMIDAAVGGFLGVLIGYLIKKTSPKCYWLKGWGVGLMAWIFLFGLIFHNLPNTQELAPKDVLSTISAYIGHSLFGIVTALAYVKLAKLDSSESSWKRK